MTDLIDRIIGSDGAEKINVHHFIGQYTLVSEAIRTPQEVVGEFNVRGGIKTAVNAEYRKGKTGKAGWRKT